MFKDTKRYGFQSEIGASRRILALHPSADAMNIVYLQTAIGALIERNRLNLIVPHAPFEYRNLNPRSNVKSPCFLLSSEDTEKNDQESIQNPPSGALEKTY